MGHYAKIINGKVLSVIVADENFFNEFIDNSPGFWLKTSYNTRGGVHYGEDGQPDGGVALRANYAGVEHIYDQDHDVFYAPQPFPSWTISGPDWIWKAPVPVPEDGKEYYWDEILLNWSEKTFNANT
jgi:hypothetical protein